MDAEVGRMASNVTYDEDDEQSRGPDLIGMVRDECQTLIDSYRPTAADGTLRDSSGQP